MKDEMQKKFLYIVKIDFLSVIWKKMVVFESFNIENYCRYGDLQVCYIEYLVVLMIKVRFIGLNKKGFYLSLFYCFNKYDILKLIQ